MLELLKAHITNKVETNGKVHISNITQSRLTLKATYNSAEITVHVEMMSNKYKLEIKNSQTELEYTDEELHGYIDNTIRMLIISKFNEKQELPIWSYIEANREERLARVLLKARKLYQTKEFEYDMTGVYQNAFQVKKTTIVGDFIYKVTKSTLKIKPSKVKTATMYEIRILLGVFYAVMVQTKQNEVHAQFYFVQEAQDGIHVQVGFKDGSKSIRLVTREGY